MPTKEQVRAKWLAVGIAIEEVGNRVKVSAITWPKGQSRLRELEAAAADYSNSEEEESNDFAI